ncbi:BTAD domain-containing putative transcriptional regulator [Lentzea guizhouensis]|uniref:BTAD domain-containing putative transcriptional regulator n=1 Tax=Lentzea guizhouensis TaxID=1586287 RepID=UPI0008FF1E5E|nr:BTAD domain-containing putative transcriptional regulator [Lentzea guizhouensis]
MNVLGPLEVWRDGSRVGLGGVKQRALLAHLALNANTAVSLDQIVEVLWPTTKPRSVVANVRTYVWQLRQLLGECLRTHGTGYVLALKPDELDALQFEHLVNEARTSGNALELLAQAEALWRGRPLEDVPENDAWQPVIARLEEARLAATEQRLALQIAHGQADEVIAEMRALLEVHPYRESIGHQLMVALQRTNRRVEALQVYTDLRERLAEELGLEPGPALKEAHLAVLRGDADERAPIRQLPPSVADFCGRATEIAGLTAALRTTGGVAVAGVTGAPGVGKSALAVRVAHEVSAHYPDGQLYVDLGGTAEQPRDPADVLTELLHALGVTAPGCRRRRPAGRRCSGRGWRAAGAAGARRRGVGAPGAAAAARRGGLRGAVHEPAPSLRTARCAPGGAAAVRTGRCRGCWPGSPGGTGSRPNRPRPPRSPRPAGTCRSRSGSRARGWPAGAGGRCGCCGQSWWTSRRGCASCPPVSWRCGRAST